ncbi:MAG TPA: hypothetical protein VFB22_16620 [Candidatus Baltobacteraceae bacterium]|nr:hypothetical protein [Candidatus Baltobacteraceae bacterium]
MLNALVEKFGGRSERRSADRIRRRFPVAWLRDGAAVPGQGLEISVKGVLFATKEPPAEREVDVAIGLNARKVRARIEIVRRGQMSRDGVEWTILAGVFEGIAADDWDAIVRFCKNVPEPQNKAKEELASLAHGDDDAYRLLPLKVQERIVAMLIAAGRLNPGSDAKNPLLKMTYGGKSRTGGHVLSVRSRRHVDGEVAEYDSTLHVDDSGSVRLDR